MSGRKTGNCPLNTEKNQCVTNDVMFTYVYEKINILLSVLSIFFFLFYDFNLNTQGFVSLEFVKYPQERASFREMQCVHICYIVVFYIAMHRCSSYIEINCLSFRCYG